MGTRQNILALAKKGDLYATQLAKQLGISRQTVTSHLRRLVKDGALVKAGSTRGASYRLAAKTAARKSAERSEQTLSLVKKIKGLQEDVVFRELSLKLSLQTKVSKNVYSILAYAFTEMLNNAIDHSKSDRAFIEMTEGNGETTFEVRDRGIGVFKNVQRTFRLADEFAGLEHVLKGKQTTAPEAHSGEGIFFSSRIADTFVLRSHRLQATVDNKINDTFVSEKPSLSGTLVRFSISNRSRRKLDDLFQKHSKTDGAFDATTFRVKISSYSGALSRSQARRLVFGLEKYKQVTFNFTGVSEIGQAFADEVFRVFAKRHPNITVVYEGANRAVEFMIQRARRVQP